MSKAVDKLIEGNKKAANQHRKAYARELAIGFAEWVHINAVAVHDNDIFKWEVVITHKELGEVTEYCTTEELFNLYIKSINKTK